MTQKATGKTMQKKGNDARYVADIHIRITEEERLAVLAKADELGCNMSQAARTLLFRRTMSSLDSLSEKEKKHRLILALQGTRVELRKVAADYTAVTESLLNSMEATDRKGNPALTSAQTIRMMQTLEDLTLRLQDSFNAVLHELEAGKEDAVKSDGRIAELARTAEERERINYSNMEKIEIIGRLVGDASSYKTKTGAERLRMRITCDSLGKGGAKVTREWVVFYGKTECLGLLKDGRSVFAGGDFSCGENGELIILADTLKLFD